ncbi:hypothetical protein C9I56_21880 [Paraburkholderia caribensis]|jgi:hypothetical protein|uniref:Immunity protein 49 of polymorphic toxin system n=2 Tax=Paraburkholderia caribensis TaxID=75105 RepID=A0A9Q6WR28_9BURK|nr:hypothetical protein ATN79_42090 [Paraburkholderia caribensis]PTB26679.1 hypothetical protein C9I56_21880 [Paraburkholderia caribensis]QLB67862.1 hypothetical protein A9O66_36485 [Paraburkholderia caribensis]CAG9197798.1 conserved hypothetical protein [Paraburkholderia caribensis]
MKPTMNEATMIQQGIKHVQAHQRALSEKLDFFLSIIDGAKGDPDFCLLRLASHASATALTSWYLNGDLELFKQWSYVSGKLEYVQFKRNPGRWFPAYLLLMPLMSDNEALIQWFMHNDLSFDMGKVSDSRTAEFHAYQALLALRGEWKALEERSLSVIGHSAAKMKKYEIDHRFYLALSRHDVDGMESVLQELTSPKIAKVRNSEQAFGFTEKLIGTHAVIYAKIAWRHGFKLKVNSPWIPEEWLPVSPLSHYVDPYRFLEDLAIV